MTVYAMETLGFVLAIPGRLLAFEAHRKHRSDAIFDSRPAWRPSSTGTSREIEARPEARPGPSMAGTAYYDTPSPGR